MDPEAVEKIQDREDARLEQEFSNRAFERLLQAQRPAKKRTGKKLDRLKAWEESDEREQEDESARAGQALDDLHADSGGECTSAAEGAGASYMQAGLLSGDGGEDEG